MTTPWKQALQESLAHFQKELDDFTEKLIPHEIWILQTKIGLEALTRIVLRTPVDTGRARANWFVTIDGGYDGTSDAVDPSGRGAISYGTATIKGAAPFSTLVFTNNLDYIEVLEEGKFIPPNPGPSKDPRRGRKGRILVSGGHSTQAPAGMVLVTVEELRTMFV